MLIKNEKILSVFNCFWKVFCFCKMSKISKTIQPCSGDLVAGTSSYMPPVVSLLRSFRGSLRDFLASGTSSRKKYLDKFFKFFCHKVFVDLV